MNRAESQPPALHSWSSRTRRKFQKHSLWSASKPQGPALAMMVVMAISEAAPLCRILPMPVVGDPLGFEIWHQRACERRKSAASLRRVYGEQRTGPWRVRCMKTRWCCPAFTAETGPGRAQTTGLSYGNGDIGMISGPTTAPVNGVECPDRGTDIYSVQSPAIAPFV